MNALRLAVAVLLLLPTLASAAPPTPAGFWQGTLAIPGRPIVLVAKISADGQGRLQGTLDVPTSWVADLPLEGITLEGTRFSFDLRIDAARFEGQWRDGGRIEGEWIQAGQRFPLTFERIETPPPPALRAQTPRPPFPYRTEEITVENRTAGVRLAGTLTLPEGPGPFPAAVLLSVAGPNDRDQTHSGHKPYAVLADALTRRGFAVLRFDDRGVGASSGVLQQASYSDLAEDAWAAAETLRGQKEIDPRRIGFIGNSEGTAIAALTASRHPETAFLVLLGALGLPGAELIKAQTEALSRRQNVPEDQIRQGIARMDAIFRAALEETDDTRAAERIRQIQREAAQSGARPLPLGAVLASPLDPEAWIRVYLSPWYRSQLRNDPKPHLTQVRCPVLALTGSLDPITPPSLHLPAILTALLEGGNPDATATVLPGVNHLLQTARTGLPAEYESLEESFSPQALEVMGDWLQARFLNRG